MKERGEDVLIPLAKRRGPTAGMRVKRENNLCRSAVRANPTNRQTAGALPGIGFSGGVLHTYSWGSDLWDVWGS